MLECGLVRLKKDEAIEELIKYTYAFESNHERLIPHYECQATVSLTQNSVSFQCQLKELLLFPNLKIRKKKLLRMDCKECMEVV